MIPKGDRFSAAGGMYRQPPCQNIVLN